MAAPASARGIARGLAMGLSMGMGMTECIPPYFAFCGIYGRVGPTLRLPPGCEAA